jgi:hypothetical protein
MTFNGLTITAELKQWHLDDERCSVEGIVHGSIDEDYIEGELFIIIHFTSITYYEEHNVVENHNGKYFLLRHEEEL